MPVPEHDSDKKLRYIRWALFMLPIFLFLYTLPSVLVSVNPLLFLFLLAIPVASRKMKQRQKILLYLLAEFILMLLIIVATVALYDADTSRNVGTAMGYESIANAIPVLTVIITAEGAFSFIFISEGLSARRLPGIMYSYIIATGTLLNELAVAHFAKTGHTSFAAAFTYTESLQGRSIYGLLTSGSQSGMPLRLFVPSVWPVMLSLFVLSFLAFFSYIYVTNGGSAGMSLDRFTGRIATGVVAGVAVMIGSMAASTAGYQFMVISAAILATTAAAVMSGARTNGVLAAIFRRARFDG